MILTPEQLQDLGMAVFREAGARQNGRKSEPVSRIHQHGRRSSLTHQRNGPRFYLA